MTMERPRSRGAGLRRILAAYIQPLIFVIGFPLAFGSALHAPTPHDLPLLIVGPTAAVADATTALDDTVQFTATHTDDEAQAETAVRDRQVVGSIAIEPDATGATATPTFTVTTYVASGGGLGAAAVVRQAGAQLAEQYNTTSQVVDVAPLAPGDGTGTGLFFLLAYTSLGGYLVIISLTQFLPSARLRTRYGAAAVNAIAAPLIVFGISSIYLGDYGASFGTIAGLLGIAALYVFTISAIAILIQQFLGKFATVGVMAVIVFLGFPGSGGPIPASMLPGFWRAVHEFYFSAGAMEAFRSVVYFGGNGVGRWLLQLGAWTVGIVLVTGVVHLARTSRRLRNQLTPGAPALPATSPAVAAEPAHDDHLELTRQHTLSPASPPLELTSTRSDR